MPQKIKTIMAFASEGTEVFDERVNWFCEENNVFATHTHVANEDGCIKLYAICFYRGG